VNDFVGVKDLIVMATRQRMHYPDQAMNRERKECLRPLTDLPGMAAIRPVVNQEADNVLASINAIIT